MSETILEEITHGYLHSTVFDVFEKYAKKDNKILDAGSGTGAWGKRLLDSGYKDIYLIDGFLEPKTHFDNFIKSNLNEKLPYKNEEFDIITSIEVIEHMEDQFSHINELLRCVKKGGYIIISTPNINTFLSKILFLFTGNLFCFLKNDAIFTTFPNHINPFYLPAILGYYESKMTLVDTYYSVFVIPFTKISLPLKFKYFGNTSIYVFRKS